MNFIAQVLEKKPEDICKKDILDYIRNKKIKIFNLCYIGSDSKLKSVSFPASNLSYIDSVLSRGERIANVFLNSNIKSEGSYIVPRYRTAFSNPFSNLPTLNILCSCFNKDGELSPAAPSTVLEKANKRFVEKTGLNIKVAGELEYFVLYPDTYDLFKTTLKHYHSSSPFTALEDMRNDIIDIIGDLGISVKYAHSECGKLYYGESSVAEQQEIEFLPAPICEAGDLLVISKWVICNVAKRYGVSVTFSPVIEYGKPGNGLHFHFEILKSEENIVLDKQGSLTSESKQAIGGMLKFARSLCAFGNPCAISYLRLRGKKESPYGICWSERSRKVLIRIPMSWYGIGTQMSVIANPYGMQRLCRCNGDNSQTGLPSEKKELSDSQIPGQTIEFRSADGMAVVHLLLAGLIIAVGNGLQDNSVLSLVENLHITEKEMETEKIKPLPQSCQESAKELEKDRKYYEKDGIFPPELIDSILLELKSYGTQMSLQSQAKSRKCGIPKKAGQSYNKNEALLSNPSENEEEIKKLIKKYIYYSPFSFY